jgi:hypothetical protein
MPSRQARLAAEKKRRITERKAQRDLMKLQKAKAG